MTRCERAERFAERYRGSARDDRRGRACAEAMTRAGRDLRPRRPCRAPTRRCDFATDTTDPARGALVAAASRSGDGARDDAAVLRARVGGARATSAPRSCSPTTGWTSAATTCARARRYRPHLLSEPEELILTEKSISGASAWTRLFERADLRDRGRARTPRRRSTWRSSRLASPSRERAPRGRRGGHALRSNPACAPAPSSSTRCSSTRRPTTACATTTHWLAARNLANEASDESVAGADRGGHAGATSWRAAGTG